MAFFSLIKCDKCDWHIVQDKEHVLQDCPHEHLLVFVTERYNLACCMIFKAIIKPGSLGSCVDSIDIGSNKRMTMQNLQIPETAESRIGLFPNGSSHPASQIKTDLPPAAQILCWSLPSLQKHKNNKLM